MDPPPSLSEILAFQQEMQRLDALIDPKKNELMERFPEILQIMATQSYKIYVMTTAEQSAGLEDALKDTFNGEQLIIEKTDEPPALWPIMKMLCNVGDKLDAIMCGYYLGPGTDEEGPFIDMRLGENTPENRAIVEAAFPGARIKFAKNDREMRLEILPG